MFFDYKQSDRLKNTKMIKVKTGWYLKETEFLQIFQAYVYLDTILTILSPHMYS